MITPRIEINLRKIVHNAKTLKELYGSKGIDVIGVTKVVCVCSDCSHIKNFYGIVGLKL